MAQDKAVTITVLVICILLTAFTTAGIFMTVICCTVRRRQKQEDWEAQRESFQQLNPGHSIPHTIDLRKSYAGPPSKFNAAPDSSRSSESSGAGEETKATLMAVHEMGGSTTPLREVMGSTVWAKDSPRDSRTATN